MLYFLTILNACHHLEDETWGWGPLSCIYKDVECYCCANCYRMCKLKWRTAGGKNYNALFSDSNK